MGSHERGFRCVWLCAGLIILAVAGAYSNSLHGPFVLDDASSIVTNPTIRQLWPPLAALNPPNGHGLTVEARPILNLSLALNYAVGGTSVVGYHVANVAIHALAALVLFGVFRRLIGDAWIALGAALVWALHPLDTAAVTYVIQRAESLMALFYLLTLYGFLRMAGVGEPQGPAPGNAWGWVSVLACALGMATKEVMVSAPLVVFAIDSVLVSSSGREALLKRGRYYAALALTWVIVVILAVRSSGRGGTSGLGSGISPITYWATQPTALLHYLRLVIWPSPLVFDYGATVLGSPFGEVAAAAVVVALFVAVWLLLRMRSVWGVAGLWFFAILAPTSLVPGARQIMAEHRMYLALAAVLWAVAAAIALLPPSARRVAVTALMAAALLLGCLTRARNRVYASALDLYASDVSATPRNAYALGNETTALLALQRYPEAEALARRAVEASPRFAAGWDDLGTALLHEHRADEAVEALRTAVSCDPTFATARGNLAQALLGDGHLDEAVEQAGKASAQAPSDPDLKSEWGSLLAQAGHLPEARIELEASVALNPGNGDAQMNLGLILAAQGESARAIECLETAARLEPASALPVFNLGRVLSRSGDPSGTRKAYLEAIAREPGYAPAHENLGNLLLAEGDVPAALKEYLTAVAEEPNRADYHYNLGCGMLRAGNRQVGLSELRKALALKPDLAAARALLDRLGER